MLTVDDYGAIRRARRDGKSIRQIAREFGHSRNTIRKALKHPEPIAAVRSRSAPMLGQFYAIVDQILQDDELAPPKQRHTAAQIFRRLRQEHAYTGGYAQVQRYLLRHRKAKKETFIPLGHRPGERLEADFGHIYVDFPDGRRLIPFLVTTWAYSNCPFVVAMPSERTEAILEGMVRAFEFFGCVPKEVWWDNPKTVATSILLGRERRLHPRYAALASHYVFNPMFCTPRRGNEKPDVENTVRAVQRRFSTPVPRVRDLEELNKYFRDRCEAERARTVQSLFGSFVIGERFTEEQAVAAPLPKHRFDPCVIRPAVHVDKYQTVAFERNRYSVPRPFAFQMVTVKGYVHEVVIVAKGEIVARHTRPSQRDTLVLDPLHYLATLDRKPGALDHAPVYRDWKLPACFHGLRGDLEQHHGAVAGAQRFVKVLQLLADHPMARVSAAIEACRRDQLCSAEAVIQRTLSLAARAAMPGPSPWSSIELTTLPEIQVPAPDLSRFNHLLNDPTDDDDFADDRRFASTAAETHRFRSVTTFFT